MENEKVYSIINRLIGINVDLQEQLDRLYFFEKEADLKHIDFDAKLKELDSRISKIEKDKMAKEIIDLINSESDIEFKRLQKM